MPRTADAANRFHPWTDSNDDEPSNESKSSTLARARYSRTFVVGIFFTPKPKSRARAFPPQFPTRRRRTARHGGRDARHARRAHGHRTRRPSRSKNGSRQTLLGARDATATAIRNLSPMRAHLFERATDRDPLDAGPRSVQILPLRFRRDVFQEHALGYGRLAHRRSRTTRRASGRRVAPRLRRRARRRARAHGLRAGYQGGVG